MKFKIIVFFSLLIVSIASFAQTDSLQTESIHVERTPIPVELFAGNRAMTFQLIVSKQLSPKSRFGFFNVTNFMGNYDKVNQNAEFFSQSLLTANVWRGFSLTAGVSTVGSSSESAAITVRPTAGMQYMFASHDFLVVVLPRFDLTQTYNFETFAVFEYKPMFSKNWGIYSRLQGLYNFNTKLDFHEVSSIYLRLGLSYKDVQFGVGTNHDFYGPGAYNVNNFGVFIRTELF